MNDKLTQREYWDSVHETGPAKAGVLRAAVNRIKQRLARRLGESFVEAVRDYSEYLLWRVILDHHLPREKGLRVLEIGSAPGFNLLKFHKMFGYEPYGIEYTQNGVELNRRLFRERGIDPTQVIQGDFLSDEVRRPLEGRFDIVTSFGFVEHFSDVRTIVEKHLQLLKSGGLLVVGIPNIAGANDLLTRFFHRDVLSLHNLSIMDETSFRSLFERPELKTRFCGYFGAFTFYLFNTKPGSMKRFVLSGCRGLQRVLNVAFYLLFRNRGWEHPRFSPYLLFIGQKT